MGNSPEMRCPDCGRRGTPVVSLQPPDSFCPYCGASYRGSSRLRQWLLIAVLPFLALGALFAVIFAAGLTTALVVVVAVVAALALWLTMARPGQG
jgi:hypothetical protein